MRRQLLWGALASLALTATGAPTRADVAPAGFSLTTQAKAPSTVLNAGAPSTHLRLTLTVSSAAIVGNVELGLSWDARGTAVVASETAPAALMQDVRDGDNIACVTPGVVFRAAGETQETHDSFSFSLNGCNPSAACTKVLDFDFTHLGGELRFDGVATVNVSVFGGPASPPPGAKVTATWETVTP